jgi:hypothetical protein
VIWSWGALALAVTYGTQVLVWKEWWRFCIGFGAAAGLCWLFSFTLDSDAEKGGEADAAMLRLARYVAMVQLFGMVVTMLGLVIDGKMIRFLNPRFTDWAANNVFFFGAMALALRRGAVPPHPTIVGLRPKGSFTHYRFTP